MENDLQHYIANHMLCMTLSLQYLQQISKDIKKRTEKTDLSQELRKYQTDELNGFTGQTWILWFLDSLVPKILEETYV